MYEREFKIHSHKGDYQVVFEENIFKTITQLQQSGSFQIIIDKKVYDLYKEKLLDSKVNLDYALIIEANEFSKSIEEIPKYLEILVQNGVRRTTTILAIGGGVIQDISCFISSLFLRGVDWFFVPTTLLAQADSCIGSKSSINLKSTKNILGTFNPPRKILISNVFMDTLNDNEIKSGLGEIIKIHALYGQEKFNELKRDYYKILENRNILLEYIEKSLLLKKKFVEEDEFDRSSRLVLNYGHSFGHAIESASNYEIPHGIAVSIGCHLANYVALKMSFNSGTVFENMKSILFSNFKIYYDYNINFDLFMKSLYKDKKNLDQSLVLILPNKNDLPVVTKLEKSELFTLICKNFFENRMYYV